MHSTYSECICFFTMSNNREDKHAYFFVVKIIAVYAVWKLVHYFLLLPNTALNQTWMSWINALGNFYAGITSGALNLFGEETIHQGIRIIYTHSENNIRVEEHCLAIPATLIFTGSILFFAGSWKNKLWFIPLGIFAVFVINTIRLVLLSYTFEHFSATFFDINHSFVYVVITYSLIMLLIVWWMKKFSVSAE